MNKITSLKSISRYGTVWSKEPKAASFEESGTCTAPGGDE